jgi:hypothetical protein
VKNAKKKTKAEIDECFWILGVTLRAGKRYRAQIWDNGKDETIGTYNTAKQAAKAYDAAAIELGRPLSKLNFPKKQWTDIY